MFYRLSIALLRLLPELNQSGYARRQSAAYTRLPMHFSVVGYTYATCYFTRKADKAALDSLKRVGPLRASDRTDYGLARPDVDLNHCVGVIPRQLK